METLPDPAAPEAPHCPAAEAETDQNLVVSQGQAEWFIRAAKSRKR